MRRKGKMNGRIEQYTFICKGDVEALKIRHWGLRSCQGVLRSCHLGHEKLSLGFGEAVQGF
jgi:hypothetical protein